MSASAKRERQKASARRLRKVYLRTRVPVNRLPQEDGEEANGLMKRDDDCGQMSAYLVNQTGDSAEKPHWMTIHRSRCSRNSSFGATKPPTNFQDSPKVLPERLITTHFCG
jgi:hypothetical protein